MECLSIKCERELIGRQTTYCSDKCRKSQSRTKSRIDESRTNLELCRYCGNDLPRLEKSRQHPGACLDCVMKMKMPKYELDARQISIWQRNADTRARLASIPIAELESGKAWIPVWRYA